MIVSELITKLQEMPKDARVLGRGYENGYNNLEEVELQDVLHLPDGPWYDGEYQDIAYYNEHKGYEQISAVTLT